MHALNTCTRAISLPLVLGQSEDVSGTEVETLNRIAQLYNHIALSFQFEESSYPTRYYFTHLPIASFGRVAFQNAALCRCKNCGRTFFEASYSVHIKGCREGKPIYMPLDPLTSLISFRHGCLIGNAYKRVGLPKVAQDCCRWVPCPSINISSLISCSPLNKSLHVHHSPPYISFF